MNALRDWTQLLCVSALFTVPGDALAGAAAAGVRADRSTLRDIGCSLCLYEAGMALNDWADRDEDACERPNRPSRRVAYVPPPLWGGGRADRGGSRPGSAAGRPATAVAGALAVTVWAYDLKLKLKHTRAGRRRWARPGASTCCSALWWPGEHRFGPPWPFPQRRSPPWPQVSPSVRDLDCGISGAAAVRTQGEGRPGPHSRTGLTLREPAARHAETVCRTAFACPPASVFCLSGMLPRPHGSFHVGRSYWLS